MTGSTYVDRGRAPPKNHRVYSDYTTCLKLSSIDHSALSKRGLSGEQIVKGGYTTKPGNRSKVAMNALASVESKYDLDEVPGFYIDDKGHRNHSGITGLVVPSRDIEGQICSLVVRLEKPNKHQGRVMNKYMAFSSAKYTMGGKVWQNTHCPIVKGHPKDVAGDIVRVTEGVLKADVATALGKYYCLGFHGVNPHRDLSKVLSEIEVDTVHVCFDAGEDTPDVIRGRALTIKAIREYGCDVKVEMWDAEYGKGIDDVLKNGHEDKIRILTDEELEKLMADADVRDPNNGDWIYVIAAKAFFNIHNYQQLDKSQFADKFDLMKVSKVNFMLSEGFPRVDDTGFAPNKDKFYYKSDLKYLNLWENPGIDAVKGDVSLLHEHVKYLFPNEEEAGHLLDWIAHCISKPGDKIHYAILMKSEAEGVGKSWFGEMIREVLGHDNTCMISSQMLNENFTGWAKKSCFGAVEEVWSAGKVEFMNKIKPLITQPKVLIREMQRETYEIDNHINFLMTTNYSDAIRLAKEDRRYLVMVSDAKPRGPEYYDVLFDWIKTSEAKSALLHYFTKEHEYTKTFKPKGKAPDTDAKQEMIDASRSRLEAYIEDGIADCVPPFNKDLFCIRHAKEWSGCPRGLDSISDHKWSEALKGVGAYKIESPVTLSNKTKARLWIIRRHETLKDLPSSKLVELYEKGIVDMETEPGSDQFIDDNVVPL